jgi:hypothetical protein
MSGMDGCQGVRGSDATAAGLSIICMHASKPALV